MKQCSICKEWKPLDKFNNDKNGKYGKTCMCRDCQKEYYKQYYITHKKHINKIEVVKKNNNYDNYFASSTIKSHKQKGYKISVSKEFIKNLINESEYCPICGVKYKKIYGEGRNDNAPSLDRINNENELNENNIQIICNRCNRTKSNRTMDEFIAYCKIVVEKCS